MYNSISETVSVKALDLHINRFHITNPECDELLIRKKRSKRFASFGRFLMFGGMGAFFWYLFVHYYAEGGFNSAAYICLCFGVFMSVCGVFSLVNGYSKKQSYHFKKTEVIITNVFGGKKIIRRSEVKSVFISKTLFAERGKSADDYAYWVTLRVPYSKSAQHSLFYIEGRDSLMYMVGEIDQKGMEQAENESHRIAEIIAEHWNIPVSI